MSSTIFRFRSTRADAAAAPADADANKAKLDPARGIALGIVLAAVFWAVVAGVLIYVFT